MAKRETWEKRARKVKKEEHLILGGNTNNKKEGFKKKKFSGGPSNEKFEGKGNSDKQFRSGDRKNSYSKFTKDKPFNAPPKPGGEDDGLTRLNKYLAMAGICSRREADKFIEDGLVEVNGITVTELGTKVTATDKVTYAGEAVNAEIMRYVLLNKPKDCVTSIQDEKGRSTVMALVKTACKERIIPVGRLDRNTTGLLLLTNDGDMIKKLTHPSSMIRKVYHVIVDKNVSKTDLSKLETGVELQDGLVKAEAALYVGDGSVRTEVGIEIHSGKNWAVTRMFEELGYKVMRLDRAAYAGLGKKGLPRGRWRFLTEKEISYLKML
jgi:23S rRNA pseudouridine2605 synthase